MALRSTIHHDGLSLPDPAHSSAPTEQVVLPSTAFAATHGLPSLLCTVELCDAMWPNATLLPHVDTPGGVCVTGADSGGGGRVGCKGGGGNANGGGNGGGGL